MRKTRSVSEYGLDGEQGSLIVNSKMIVRTFGPPGHLLDLFDFFLDIFIFLTIFGHF